MSLEKFSVVFVFTGVVACESRCLYFSFCFTRGVKQKPKWRLLLQVTGVEKIKRGKNRSFPSAYSSKERIMEVCFFWFIHPTMELRYCWKHGTSIGTNVKNDNKLIG